MPTARRTRPARQDSGAEGGDAEQQPAEDVDGPAISHRVERLPRSTALAVPLSIAIQPATNSGAAAAKAGRIKLDEGEAEDEQEPEAQQQIAGQTDPAGFLGLPGVKSRKTEHTED